MDIKHVLSLNPLQPAYRDPRRAGPPAATRRPTAARVGGEDGGGPAESRSATTARLRLRQRIPPAPAVPRRRSRWPTGR